MKRHIATSGLILLFSAFVCAQENREEFLARQFDRYDRNNDGVLTRGEVRNDAIFRRLDLNRDGRVTRDEGRRATTRTRATPRPTPAPTPRPPSTPSPVATPKPAATLAPDATPTTVPLGRGIHRVRSYRDIPYRELPGVEPSLLSLDIYQPVGVTSCPVVVYFHGGAWSAGDKSGASVATVKAPFMASNGFLFVSANYRLSPAVRHPTHVEDAAHAVAFVHNHAASYGGDPSRLFVMGHTAGAHLAALLATDARHLQLAGKSMDILKGAVLIDGTAYDVPRAIGADTALAAACERAFGTDEIAQADASPLLHAGEADGSRLPPFLIIHVPQDGEARRQSEVLAAILGDSGAEAELVTAEGRNHDTLNRAIGRRDDASTQRILEFLQRHAGIAPTSSPPTSGPTKRPSTDD